MQDILFDRCYVKGLENKLRELFLVSGYREVETPTVEFFDVFSGDHYSAGKHVQVYRSTGTDSCSKPDMTIPVARIAATKLKDVFGP